MGKMCYKEGDDIEIKKQGFWVKSYCEIPTIYSMTRIYIYIYIYIYIVLHRNLNYLIPQVDVPPKPTRLLFCIPFNPVNITIKT